MDIENFSVKLEDDEDEEEEGYPSPDQITIELNSFDPDGDSSCVVDEVDDYNDEQEANDDDNDDDDEEEEDDDDDDNDDDDNDDDGDDDDGDDDEFVVENEDDYDDEEMEVDGSFSKLPQKQRDLSRREGSICVVRKPHCTKLEQSSYSTRLKRRAEHSNQPRKRGCSAKRSITTLRQVVSDAPHENKLKKPGPFQAASKVASVSNLKLRHSWLKKPKQACSDAEDESLTIADEATNEMSSVRCDYCGVLLSSALECDLHVGAQHKYEKAVQEISLKCLEEGCFVQCSTIFDLKSHLSTQHSIDLTRRNLTFKNMDEFLTWKTDLESANATRFRFFSCVSEVTGGTTRVYICNNEGRYDMTRAKHQRRRRGPGVRAVTSLRRTGRACPAQLLVRAWGWGAVEVQALLTHYGHCRDGALVGVTASTEVWSGRGKGAGKEEGASGRGCHGERTAEYPSSREDGVRIIEGALIGARGMEDLQTDLTAWNLVDNVSICLCKRHNEPDDLGLCAPEDFALGFTTSDQLDLWAARGQCAVCLDTSQVRMSGGKDSSLPDTFVSVSCVLVLSERGDACPVAWLLTSCYSDALHRHFLMCLRVAFESFQGRGVPEPKFLVCEASSQGQRLWLDAFKSSPSLLLSSWGVHKLWLPHLHKVQDQDKRLFAYTELCWASRSCEPGDDHAENLTGVLERLERDPATKNFATHLLKDWLPNSRQVSSAGKALTPEHDAYSTGIYLDILHCLLHFLFVEEQFSLDYDECVAKLNLYSATVLSALKQDAQVTPDADAALPRCRASLLITARHAEAAALGPGSVASVKPHEWQVRCHVQPGVWYSVRRQTRNTQLGALKSMCGATCKQACWQCEVCVHQYSCSCPDSIILSTVCVHVHLIRILMRNPHHGSHVETNSFAPNVIPVGINNSKIFKSKEKMKLSIRSKCATLMSMLKNNVPPTTTPSDNNNQFSKDRLSKCDAFIDQAIAVLHGDLTCAVQQTTTAEATPSLLLHDQTTTVLSSAESSGMQMLYPEQESDASAASRVPVHPSYSDAQTLGAEISTVESLLVLHEENGRIRLVGGGEEDLLQEPTNTEAQNLIYLDDARRPRIDDAALGDADSTSAELAAEVPASCAKTLVLDTVSSCGVASNCR